MNGVFLHAREVAREQLPWGQLGWCCRPADTQARGLVVIEVQFTPGGAHAFHKHPEQEEVIYVVEGEVEQWLDQDCRRMGAGDCVYIPAGCVHASFNAGSGPAKLLAILGPSVATESGYAAVEVADQAPWKDLRS